MTRTPDSRVSAGQAIEDMRDARVDEMRRRTTEWIAKSRRPAPNDAAMLADIVSGIAGGLLDSLFISTDGDPDQIRKTWSSFAEGYLEAYAEQKAADAEAVTTPAALGDADA